jgi:hypothetical protein
LPGALTVAASLGGSASLNGTVSLDGGSGFLARRLCGIHLAHRNNRRDPWAETALLRHRPTRTRRVVESGLSSIDWRNTVNVSLTALGAAGPRPPLAVRIKGALMRNVGIRS